MYEIRQVPALMLALNSPQGVIQYLAASTIRSLCIDQQPDTVKLIAKADGTVARRLLLRFGQPRHFLESKSIPRREGEGV